MTKYGLVLSGGGGKGAFQIGALRALKEKGMLDLITGISGASIGAINGCLACEGKIDAAKKLWGNISPLMFLEPDFNKTTSFSKQSLGSQPVSMSHMTSGSQSMSQEADYSEVGATCIDGLGSIANAEIRRLLSEVMTKYDMVLKNHSYELLTQNKDGVFLRDGLVKLIRENVNYKNISNSAISFYVNACECTEDGLEVEYMKLNGRTPEEIEKLILASSALPFVYDAVEYKGKYYRDGGLMDNVPIKPLHDEGCRNIIVIGLKPDYGIDFSQYKDCNFIIIMPPKSIGGFVDGTIDFSAQGAKFRMAYGYRTAMRILQCYESGKVNEPDYKSWLLQMSQLDYEAAEQDVKREKVLDEADSHMDKLRSIYNKYM